MSEPTPETSLGFSYEYAVDIQLADDVFQQIRFITAVDPQVTNVTQDAATYADRGSPNQTKTGESWSLTAVIQQRRTAEGEYLPEVEALLTLTGPDAVGSEAVGTFRWYDNPAGRPPNPREAFEGDGTVQLTRSQTGNDQIGAWQVTITGQGPRRRITHPRANGNGGGEG